MPALPNQGEVLLKVRAAALSNLVRGQANGSHYSSGTTLPFTPGNDGVGVAEDGARVYFIAPRAPFGSMAEYTVVSRATTIPLSPSIEDAVAAALGNPGLATWGSLLGRAKFQAGEAVLINGATGIAGKQAIQVAKYLGASKIIATGRGTQEELAGLAALGADETISLSQPILAKNQRELDAGSTDFPKSFIKKPLGLASRRPPTASRGAGRLPWPYHVPSPLASQAKQPAFGVDHNRVAHVLQQGSITPVVGITHRIEHG